MRSHAKAVKLFGEPQRGKVYVCELESYSSGKIVVEDLKWVSKDDVDWLTADDGSEINHINWHIISWKEKV